MAAMAQRDVRSYPRSPRLTGRGLPARWKSESRRWLACERVWRSQTRGASSARWARPGGQSITGRNDAPGVNALSRTRRAGRHVSRRGAKRYAIVGAGSNDGTPWGWCASACRASACAYRLASQITRSNTLVAGSRRDWLGAVSPRSAPINPPRMPSITDGAIRSER